MGSSLIMDELDFVKQKSSDLGDKSLALLCLYRE